MRSFLYIALVGFAASQGDPKNGNVALLNDPAGCASDLASAVEAVTSAANHIVQGVASCPPKTDDKDKFCATAITFAFTKFSLASEELSSASMTCANTLATVKGARCGEDISDSIKQFGVTASFLTASTESCKPLAEGGNTFGCVADVVDVVDALASAAEGINKAVESCGAVNKANPKWAFLYDTWLTTGCAKLPNPDWIQWGYWAAESNDPAKVLKSIYDYCDSATQGTNLHNANLCCGQSKCGHACQLQTQYKGITGTPTPSNGKDIRSEGNLAESWPLVLESGDKSVE
jgi:hypothetical protein